METGEKKEQTKKELDILKLKEQLKELKLRGSFKYLYKKVRAITLDIAKNKELTDSEKCKDLINRTNYLFAEHEEE